VNSSAERLATHARTRGEAGRFGAVLGREKLILRAKIEKNREKSLKNGKAFGVDLLMAKELSGETRLQSAKITPTLNFFSPISRAKAEAFRFWNQISKAHELIGKLAERFFSCRFKRLR
jgi:hypothetical protein